MIQNGLLKIFELQKLKCGITVMKLKISILCVLLFYGFEAFAVIGGNSAPDLARHTLMVLGKNGTTCTGVVITRSTILTAAHCVNERTEYVVYFRTQSGEPVLLSPKKIITHPDYVPDAIKKRVRSIDLALINLNEPLPTAFEPIQLSNEYLSVGQTAIVGGYGLTNEKSRSSNGQFFATPVKVIEPYGRSKILIWLRGEKLTNSPFNRGGCHGDSGGPIFKDNRLIAIITWTTGPTGFDCGDITQGALIAPQRDWISKNSR